MNRWKQTAVVLTVVVSVLSGCGFIVEERPPQQGAKGSAPGVVQSSPRTGFTCCPIPEGASYAKEFFCVPGIEWYRGISGREITGNGSAWFRSDTGEYCVEEGVSIRLPGGEMVKGPRSGKYYKQHGKAVCYTEEMVLADKYCDHDLKGNVLWLTSDWFQGQCNDEKVRQFLKDHGISLEDPHWENCDAVGTWRGIALPK